MVAHARPGSQESDYPAPGTARVYLYFNSEGETIYVGKARSLRDRVRSYLGAAGVNPKTDALLDEAGRLEVIVTDSVVEALALENHLIKQRTPKYNILLRDDKNYPYLQLTTTEAFPRVLVARRVERDGDFYAGPFLPASLARKTMGLTHRLFGIRSCNEVINGRRGRPCLEYDIGRCVAPCVEVLCSPAEYAQAVQNTQLFLAGRTDELVSDLTNRMKEAAASERFEQAAHLRDAIRTVRTLQERQQKIATARLGDRDAFGLKVGPAGAVVQVFQMRRGRVIERIELMTETGAATSDAEILEASVQQFYEDREVPPKSICPWRLTPRSSRCSKPGCRRKRVRRSRCRCQNAEIGAVSWSWPTATPRSPTMAASTSPRSPTTKRWRSCARCCRCPPCRVVSSVSTFRRFRAATPSPRWSCAKPAG